MSLLEKIKEHPWLKHAVLNAAAHPVKARPRLWLRLFMPLYIRRGRGSVIYRSVRRDLMPNHAFHIGRKSVIESYSAVNNAVGDVIIGDRVRLGIGGTIIGPVILEDYVFTGQNCLISGLIHNYEDPHTTIIDQGVSTAQVRIGRETYIGANCVVVAGVTIGEHCVVGACSVVNRDIPPYTVCAGVPARPIKRYDFDRKEWIRV